MIQINRRIQEYRYSQGYYDTNKQEKSRIQIQGENMIQINRRKQEYRYSRGNYDTNKQEKTRIQIQPGTL